MDRLLIGKTKAGALLSRPPLLAALLLLSGCFDEPVPACKTVPAGSRVYLQDRGLKDLAETDLSMVGDYLNLDRNELTDVRPVADLAGLKWLRLNDNRLSALPDLSKLVNLRRIYLRGNRFESVPEVLKGLPALTDVDLSHNPISEVPDWFVRKAGLTAISLSGTRISALPPDLTAWKSLKQLQLGELNLSSSEMARIRAALPTTAIVF